MSQEKTLREFVNEHGQTEAAKLLGVTQGAISKALCTGRNIMVAETPNRVRAYEIRSFPVAQSSGAS